MVSQGIFLSLAIDAGGIVDFGPTNQLAVNKCHAEHRAVKQSGPRRSKNEGVPDKDCPWVDLPVPCRLIRQSNKFAQSFLTVRIHVLVEVVFDDVHGRHVALRPRMNRYAQIWKVKEDEKNR